jgi:TatD DNase family protein
MKVLVDSHCHLDKLDYENAHQGIADVLDKAKQAGVSHFLCVGCSLQTIPNMLSMIEDHDNVFASCGVHPLDVESGFDYEKLKAFVELDKVVAIGETGLDYFYQPELASLQQDIFRQQVRLAVAVNKPLIIHTRQAREDTLAILQEEGAERCRGVIHCFTEDLAFAEAAMALGFYISISGIVTFKKSTELQDVVRSIPLDRLLVETDSPFLAPIPHRGKENQPAYVSDVAKKVAELKGVSIEEITEITTRNFFDLFHTAK